MSTSERRGMSTATAIIGMLVALGVGYFLGGYAQHGNGSSGDLAVVPAGALPDPSVQRYQVPIGSAPIRGADTAKVTIIEYSDFQCPFCGRVEPTLKQITDTYGKQVRVVWKNNPLPFHQFAAGAAEAAMEANAEGKFWPMHDLLFQNQQKLDKDSLLKYASQVGVSSDKVKEAVDTNKYASAIRADQAEAAKFGARGTPSFFINGRPLSGAQPFEAFKKIIDEEVANADKAINAGVAANQVYQALTHNAKTSAAEAQNQQRPPAPDLNTIYKVPTGNAPARGGKDAKVTIVEFSDFQCPFCGRVEPTLKQIMQDYGNDVKIVWKNNPLPFHPHAMPTAEAAMAAYALGGEKAFWEFHDKIYADQQHEDDATFEKYAQEIGLNMSKFKADLASHKYQKEIKEDMALAAQFGARGTPSFFINGRPLRGAQPIAQFKTVIDKGIADAKAAEARGVPARNLYAELTKNGRDKAEVPAAQQRPGEPDPNTVYKALIGDAPIRGPKNAKVTIVEFSDFQCPFCGRVEPTLKQVLSTYPKEVRLVFKELPLPFHQYAHVAAEAALAAKAQGGDKAFWAIHDKMYANQEHLTRADLEKYAQEIGLNMAKFKADLDSGKWKQKVDAEEAEGNKIGARGTPSFFINGKSFVGAQPFEAFKGKIDDAIKEADATMKKDHVTASRLYDTIMKSAKSEVAAAGPRPGAPPADNKIYKVAVGDAPTKGPKNAPIQIVEFSDFQCPFCGRVEPTIQQIETKYKGKVHFAWKNYPLPFHQYAHEAAEAAEAAKAQGGAKAFWAMHDKMFANQQALTRADLEKYAQEIGLDVGKFKEALDAGTYKKEVDSDVAYANSLGTGGFGTPTFFINGHKVSGALPFDSFAQVIDQQLKHKD